MHRNKAEERREHCTHTHTHTHRAVSMCWLYCWTRLYEFLLASNPPSTGNLIFFNRGRSLLFIRSDQPWCTVLPSAPTLSSYHPLSALCVLVEGGEGGVEFFWSMVRLMRCGSDTESVLLLLISAVAEGGRDCGIKGVGGKRLRDDGKEKQRAPVSL